MRHVRRRALPLFVIALLGLLPVHNATAQTIPPAGQNTASALAQLAPPPPGIATPPPPRPVQKTVASVTDPHLPSLTLDLTVTPQPIAIGDTAAVTVTVTNQAPDPAADLKVTLPTPDGAAAQPGPGFVSAAGGWQWTQTRLDGGSSAILTATLHLTQAPQGNALLLHPAVTATGVPRPVEEVGGAVAVQGNLQTGTIPFVPGASTVLRSGNGAVRCTSRRARRPSG